MDNDSTKHPYHFNPHHHVKIWFSSDENIFLNPENQLRLVRMRTVNPDDKISFVYSRKLLSAQALVDLEHFCIKHNLQPLSIEDDIKPKLSSDQERRKMAFAELELQHAKNQTGGNLAAASDIIRLLSPVYKAGVYSDLDVSDINTAGLPDKVYVDAPILFDLGTAIINKMNMDGSVQIQDDPDPIESIMPNNNVIIIPEVNAELNDDKQQQALAWHNRTLENLHKALETSYQNFHLHLENIIELIGTETENAVEDHIQATLLLTFNPEIQIMLQLHEMTANVSLFELRRNLSKLEDYDEVLIEKMQTLLTGTVGLFPKLGFDEEAISKALSEKDIPLLTKAFAGFIKLVHSNMQTNGIDTTSYYALHKSDKEMVEDFISKSRLQLFKLSVTASTGPALLYFVLPKMFARSSRANAELGPFSIKNYESLKNAFKTPYFGLHMTVDQLKTLLSTAKFGVYGDFSWSAEGANDVKKREQNLNASAAAIQMWYKGCKAKQTPQLAAGNDSVNNIRCSK